MHALVSNMEKKHLLFYIDAVSFAALDASLYLDTHPKDTEALEYFEHFSKARRQALHEYSVRFGPLTLDTAQPDNCWQWATQPWPWEGDC